MSQRKQAVLALTIAALLWSTGGVLVKEIPWHPMAISGVRSVFAAALLWAAARRLRFELTPAKLAAAVAYAVTVTLYIPACKLTTAANAIMLEYTSPVWIALFGAWFLKEKPRGVDVASIAVSLVGMVLFFFDGLSGAGFLGDLLALASGVTIAIMMLLLRHQKDGAPIESLVLGNLLAALIGLPWAFSEPALGLRGWTLLVALGVFQLGLSYALYAFAIKHVTALQAVLILMLEPILNPIWVSLIVGERPTGWALIGGLLVLSSSATRGIMLALETPKPEPLAASDAAEAVPVSTAG